MKRRSLALAAACASLFFASSAWAVYPDKPVRLVVPFAPGGGTDIVGRLIADRLGVLLKQPFIVENKPGAGAMLGADYVAKSPADGYTLLVGTSAELTIGPKLTPSLARYNPVKDFVPVALVGTSPNVILAGANFPVKTIPELITYAKANPDRVSYGSGGTGTSPHLSGELLKSMGKFTMTHIPYKGTGPALTDLIAGQTQLMISTVGPALPFLREHKVRAIAVTSANRTPMLPDTPTVAEQGLRGYNSVTWYALMAPAGTPKDAVERLQHALAYVLQTKEVIERLATVGVEPPEGIVQGKVMQERIQSDLDQWGRLIKAAGIRAE
jgi:tripartite-type tricarboxylate transporter receptor subunit TctC